MYLHKRNKKLGSVQCGGKAQLTDDNYTSVGSRDGGGDKSSRSTEGVCPWEAEDMSESLLEKRQGTDQDKEGRKGTRPQEQSHSPRAKTSSVFFVEYFIYSALWSIFFK